MTAETSTYGYEAVADALVAQGVETIFGLMGDDVASLVVAAQDRGITYVATRHENQAVAMADGYSRVTGRVGVVTFAGGPGFTNALTALNTAHRARSSVLAITGDADAPAQVELRNELKRFPQEAACAALGIPLVKPRPGGAAPADTQRALISAGRLRTVVLVLTPDVLSERGAHGRVAALPDVPTPPAAPDASAVAAVVDLLQETWAVRRAVILAGRGAVLSGAGPALRRLGELVGALLATSLRGIGYFDDDPHNIGLSGTYSSSVASELLNDADCVLAFGAALNTFTTYDNTLFPEALVVHVDADEAAFGRFVVPDIAVHADARLTAEALVVELESRSHAAVGYRTSKTAERIGRFNAADEVVDASTDDRIDPRTLMLELDRILPDDRILAVDGGHHTRFSIPMLRVRHPLNFAQAVEGGAIGLGMGTAIGAAVARPDTTVVLGVGDAGMMMSIGDLETAVRYELPIVVVVHNDEALGSEVNALARMGLPTAVANIRTPSFAEAAVAMGAEGMTVRSVEDLAAVEARLRERRTVPLVLDCLVNPAVRA
jgi:acetolactate synthase I/II/III large subunit